MDLINRIKAWIAPRPMGRDNGFEFWLEEVHRDKREEPEGQRTWCFVHDQLIAPGGHTDCDGTNPEWTFRQGYGWVRR